MKKAITREQFLSLSPEAQYELYSTTRDICIEYQKVCDQLYKAAKPIIGTPDPDTKQQKIDLLGIFPQS